VVQETEHGLLAVRGDWIVLAQNGDGFPESGLVTGVAVYYKLEPVGGGGVYDLVAEGRLWNEWVPFFVPTRPGYSALRSHAVRNRTLVLEFQDSVGPTAEMTYPHRAPLRFDVEITPRDDGSLDFTLGGMHMVFPAVRLGDTVTVFARSANKPDTTLMITHPLPEWSFAFAGPSTYDLQGSHFAIWFETDAPLMKLGIGGEAAADMIKFDLDHSLLEGVEYVHSRMLLQPKF
jgi:hypothetical protein